MHGACRVLAAETMTVRRSVMSAPATGFGGRCPPPARCPGSGAGSWGIEGGRSIPSLKVLDLDKRRLLFASRWRADLERSPLVHPQGEPRSGCSRGWLDRRGWTGLS